MFYIDFSNHFANLLTDEKEDNVTTTISLEAGKDAYTLLDLLRKAAEYKGLKLMEGAFEAYCEPIKTYELDSKALAVLEKVGIRRQLRPDSDRVFTLVDENSQEHNSVYQPSNYWNFKLPDPEAPDPRDREGNPRRIMLSTGLSLNQTKRGIVLSPLAHGSFLSPCDRLPNFRMFKALAESDPEAPAVAKELAASDGSTVVSWTELGLGGIRRLISLFSEFIHGNEEVDKLARRMEIFNPEPYVRYQQPGDELYVAEPAQPRLFAAWQAQLEEYRTKLRV